MNEGYIITNSNLETESVILQESWKNWHLLFNIAYKFDFYDEDTDSYLFVRFLKVISMNR